MRNIKTLPWGECSVITTTWCYRANIGVSGQVGLEGSSWCYDGFTSQGNWWQCCLLSPCTSLQGRLRTSDLTDNCGKCNLKSICQLVRVVLIGIHLAQSGPFQATVQGIFWYESHVNYITMWYQILEREKQQFVIHFSDNWGEFPVFFIFFLTNILICTTLFISMLNINTVQGLPTNQNSPKCPENFPFLV